MNKKNKGFPSKNMANFPFSINKLAIILILGLLMLSSVYIWRKNELSSLFSMQNEKTVATKVSPILEKIAFIRNGLIWIADSDGKNQIQISTQNNQYNCNYYSSYNSPFYSAQTYSNFSPWSNNKNQIAYTCKDASGLDTMYIYNLITKNTTSVSMVPPHIAKCPGCKFGFGPNFGLLKDNNNWNKTPNWYTTFHNYSNMNVESGYYTGNNIWLIEIFHNARGDVYELYDTSTNSVIYGWNRIATSQIVNGVTYYYYPYVNSIPECILNPQGTYEVCAYSLSSTDSPRGRINVLSLINVSTKKIVTKVGNYTNPIWSSDGTAIYVTNKTNTSNDSNTSKITALDKNLLEQYDVVKNASNPFPDYSIK